MAIEILTEKDGSLAPLQGKTIAVLGYGSQGHGHAQNARESGMNVIVSELEGTNNHKLAVEHGFKPMAADEAVKQADMILITLPDEVQPAVYAKQIGPNLKAGQTLCFTHGFNIHYKTIAPPKDVNVIMVAPKGPGHLVRDEFVKGAGVPCLICVEQDATGNAKDIALAWAIAIGGARAGVLVSTFKDETETDLFGEQTVLCGGLTALIKAGFETLVEAGYEPEMAYYECFHEVKLIVDLLYVGGLNYMRYSVSNTAEWGDLHVGPQIIGPEVKQNMKKALAKIQDGSFAKEWRAEYEAGLPNFKKLYDADKNSALENVGKKLRGMMPFLDTKTVPGEE